MSPKRAGRACAAVTGIWLVALVLRIGLSAQAVPPPAPPAQSVVAVPAAVVIGPGEKSALAGVFTDKQADAGADTYVNICSGCHKNSVHGAQAFRDKWVGATLLDLYKEIGELMPKDDPDSLSPDERVQLVAYVLKLNGVPAGTAELSTAEDALKKIKIEWPKEKQTSVGIGHQASGIR